MGSETELLRFHSMLCGFLHRRKKERGTKRGVRGPRLGWSPMGSSAARDVVFCGRAQAEDCKD